MNEREAGAVNDVLDQLLDHTGPLDVYVSALAFLADAAHRELAFGWTGDRVVATVFKPVLPPGLALPSDVDRIRGAGR